MDESLPAEPTRIRMFPDYAGTVLWLSEPVSYDEALISRPLALAMTVWEDFYYASLDDDLEWRSAALAARFTELGQMIARELASEVGSGFEIEFRSYEDGAQTLRTQSDSSAMNRRAAEAFEQLAGEALV